MHENSEVKVVAPLKAPPEGMSKRLTRLLVPFFGIGFFYLLVIIAFASSSDRFLTYSNLANILSNTSVIGIVALGQVLAIISGGFDLSVTGVLPLGAVTYAILSNAGCNNVEAMALSLLVGAFVGLFNGFVITRLKINPLIATLGSMSITGGLAFSLSNGATISFSNPDAGWLANEIAPGIAYYVVAFVVLAILMTVLLRLSVFGRMLYAVGGNRDASRLAGIRTDAVTVAVYVVCGALAALAGVIVSNQLLAGSATVGTDAALSSIAAVVLGGASLAGGVGSVGGTLVGVLILGTIANGMVLLQIPSFYQQIATGAILLLGVGLARLRERLESRGSK